jgi:hypothetical protein
MPIGSTGGVPTVARGGGAAGRVESAERVNLTQKNVPMLFSTRDIVNTAHRRTPWYPSHPLATGSNPLPIRYIPWKHAWKQWL